METARLTSKGQMTIPKRIRDAARLKAGDTVVLDVEGDRIFMRKLVPSDVAYLKGVERSLSEWVEPDDEDAWRNL